MQEGPYFDELAVGQEFGGAPGITLTSGLAAAHQAITGDRLALATDHDLCRRVTGGDPLASPSLVTVAAWHGCDHLGPVYEGDTLRSTISVERVDPLPAGGALVHLRSRVRAEVPGGDGGALSPSGLGWPGGGEGTGAAGGRHRRKGSAPRDVLDWRYIAVVALSLRFNLRDFYSPEHSDL